MSWTDDLFAYFGQFDPNFRRRVKGTSDGEIQQIERAMGAPVLQVHREYLGAMGVSDGGLFQSSRARTNVAAVLDMIETVKEENPTAADFTTFKPIAIGDVYEGWAVSQRGGEWPVVFIDHNLPGEFVAQSLPHLAFSTAFAMRIRESAHEVSFSIRANNIQVSDLAQQAAGLGILPEWFCDQRSYSAVCPGALLQIQKLSAKGLHGFIGAPDLEFLKNLAEVLAKPFGGKVSLEK